MERSSDNIRHLIRWTHAALIGAGMVLALYTALLKIAAIPCLTEGCNRVIQSSFGAIAGIPVGLIAFALWSVVVLCPGRPAFVSKLVLAAGSVFFLYVQAFILREFCLFCIAHSAVALLVLAFSSKPRLHPAVGYAAVLIGFVALFATEITQRAELQRELTQRRPPPAQHETSQGAVTNSNDASHDTETDTPASVEAEKAEEPERDSDTGTAASTPEADPRPAQDEAVQSRRTPPLPSGYPLGTAFRPEIGLPWLSEKRMADSALVISLSCDTCLRVLESALANDLSDRPATPLIFWSTPTNHFITRTFLAAILSEPVLYTPQDNFAMAFGLMLNHRSLFFSENHRAVRSVLIEAFPHLDRYLEEADQILQTHTDFLRNSGIRSTPGLIREGTIRHRFALEHLTD